MAEKQEEVLSVSEVSQKDEILEVNKAILRTNQEIAESLKYIRNHFRFELVVTGVKWFIIVAFIIFGFVSLGSLIPDLSASLSAVSGGLQ